MPSHIVPSVVVDKLYVVVRQDLSPGAQIAQSLHAFREYIREHPESEKNWYLSSNTIVILGCYDESELVKLVNKGKARGLKVSIFEEPDFDFSLTAAAFEPGSRTSEFLSHLRSAGKPPL